MVDWNTLSVELATKHFCANGHAEHIASELTMGMRVVNTSGSFENLQIRALEDTVASLTNGRVGECFCFCVLRLRTKCADLPGRRRACRQFRGPDPFLSRRFRAGRSRSRRTYKEKLVSFCIDWRVHQRYDSVTYLGNLTLSRMTSGPSTSSTVL